MADENRASTQFSDTPIVSEIEVTPAMIAAGVLAYCEYSPGFNASEASAVEEIYLAMRAARSVGVVARNDS